MNKITLKRSLKEKVILMAFLIMCGLSMSGNAFSREHWGHHYVKVGYDVDIDCVVIRFKFFDYDFGPAGENGYLEYGDFYYSTDGVTFNHLMRVETGDQKMEPWSWVYMKNKKPGTIIRFYDCYSPANGARWSDRVESQRVEVYNRFSAFLTIKWLMSKCLRNIKKILLVGKWHVNGVWPNEYIHGEVYDATLPTFPGDVIIPQLNTPLAVTKEKTDKLNAPVSDVKVFKEADAIVIKGAALGDNINVYTSSGVQVNSIIVNSAVVKTKLPADQIYMVHVGQARYKVAL